MSTIISKEAQSLDITFILEKDSVTAIEKAQEDTKGSQYSEEEILSDIMKLRYGDDQA